MKVYFTCTLRCLKKFEEQILKEREIILKQEGVELIRDWIPDVVQRGDTVENEPSRAPMYSDIMDNIRESDVCIFDATMQSMAIGHQLTYALEKGKPVLLLFGISHLDDPTIVDRYFISGYKSGYLTIKKYINIYDSSEIIEKFLERFSGGAKTRINLALDYLVSEAVAKKAQEDGVSRTEVIKRALVKDLKI